MDTTPSMIVSNEFASIEIRVEACGNGSQTILTDRRSGLSRRVDVLALEGLVWAPESMIARLADPSLAEVPDTMSCRVVWEDEYGDPA